ncbi:MAG: hypothetical protein HQ549_01095 [Candidatus Omnitrophica bacterium]|nr:hypothetical protein [Candidatus Omnitrophota bacterium]
MSDVVKRAIAREGLIVMGFAAACFIGFLMTKFANVSYTASGIGALIALTSIGGYVLYQFLHFFFWAILTLKEEREQD